MGRSAPAFQQPGMRKSQTTRTNADDRGAAACLFAQPRDGSRRAFVMISGDEHIIRAIGMGLVECCDRLLGVHGQDRHQDGRPCFQGHHANIRDTRPLQDAPWHNRVGCLGSPIVQQNGSQRTFSLRRPHLRNRGKMFHLRDGFRLSSRRLERSAGRERRGGKREGQQISAAHGISPGRSPSGGCLSQRLFGRNDKDALDSASRFFRV